MKQNLQDRLRKKEPNFFEKRSPGEYIGTGTTLLGLISYIFGWTQKNSFTAKLGVLLGSIGTAILGYTVSLSPLSKTDFSNNNPMENKGDSPVKDKKSTLLPTDPHDILEAVEVVKEFSEEASHVIHETLSNIDNHCHNRSDTHDPSSHINHHSEHFHNESHDHQEVQHNDWQYDIHHQDYHDSHHYENYSEF